MAQLNSLDELGWCFEQAGRLFDQKLEAYLKSFTDEVVTQAKLKLGYYQTSFGQWPTWAPLTEATQRIRTALGYTPNDPLLRSGAMHDETYGIVQAGSRGHYTVTVGSEADYAWRQELGDGRTPPRPWLGPALDKACEHIEADLCAVLYEALAEAFA